MKILPKKSLGQNFLNNNEIIKKIVELGKISNESYIIEIGPGTGNLTKEILKKKPKKYIAIEKDKQLYLNLKDKFKDDLEILNEDVLKIDWKIFYNHKFTVFGNLPYNISTKILINWIRFENLNKNFDKFILMFQKEVADRVIAKVDTNKYGRLSILTQWKMEVKKIMDINPENFFPKPKVISSLLYLEPKNSYFELLNSKNLEKVTNIFFQNKRKIIKKPLNILFKDSKKISENLNLDIKKRPQNLDFLTYLKISKELDEL